MGENYHAWKSGVDSFRDDCFTSEINSNVKYLQVNGKNQNNLNLNDILKKNEEYDQKFLFKKNFIPKHKPVMNINQLPNATQNNQAYQF